MHSWIRCLRTFIHQNINTLYRMAGKKVQCMYTVYLCRALIQNYLRGRELEVGGAVSIAGMPLVSALLCPQCPPLWSRSPVRVQKLTGCACWKWGEFVPALLTALCIQTIGHSKHSLPPCSIPRPDLVHDWGTQQLWPLCLTVCTAACFLCTQSLQPAWYTFLCTQIN